MATTNDNGMRRNKELDKFKRRMIRAVARLKLHEKVPEHEMWTKLKTETGYDCELLWGRMRSVALKKLKRMLAAEDRIDVIARMARMTVTDWLLFDLVLVHEKTDFIATDFRRVKKGELKPLTDLFSLVQKYEIEGLSGDDLAKAWTEATLHYNSQGHHVSPMLLQKRWYQLKESTRNCFYHFWFSYRGNAKLFVQASKDHMPSMLQMAIARRFKEVVTSPFMTWEEMIQNGFIILSKEFDARLRPPKKPIDENAPDLELVEPVIETIDLGDSDTETNSNKQNNTENATPALITAIKTEPADVVDEDSSAADNLMKTYPVHDDEDTYESELGQTEGFDIEDDDLVLLDNALENDENIADDDVTLADDEIGVYPEIGASDVISTPVNANIPLDNEDMTCGEENRVSDDGITKTIEILPQIISVFGNVDISSDDPSKINALPTETTNTIANSSSDDDVESITLNDDVEVKPEISIIEDTPEPQEKISTVHSNVLKTPIAVKEETCTLTIEDIIDKTCEKALENLIDQSVTGASELNSAQVKTEDCAHPFNELPSYLKLVDDGIELVDDGIAYVDEEMDYRNKQIDTIKTEDEEEGSESEADAAEEPTENIAKIDLKLLLYPVVYTTRLDNMVVLDDPYQTVDDKHLLDTILAKSKPVSKRTVNFDDIKKENDNAPTNDTISSDEDEAYENIITNENRVKLTSYLLQKPRIRNYNPISLCKNPDFNTRLKRLNVGFFGSPRNINLLKHCKPLTIDVSKAFESKLVNGTIYLKSSEKHVTEAEPVDVGCQQQGSVVPTAMALQSLIDNQEVNPIFTESSTVDLSTTSEDILLVERSKVINLPDISQVRRLNQRLLTAEVTPIQIQNNVVSPITAVPDCSHTNNTLTATTIGTCKVVEKNNEQLNSGMNKNTLNVSGIVIQDSTLNDFNVLRQPNQSVTPTPVTTANSNTGLLGNRKRTWNALHDARKKTPCPPWKSRENRPSVSWLSKNKSVNPARVDDALLTTDTLNKMLFLLTQEKDERDEIMQKKAKVITRTCNKELEKKKGRKPRKQQSDQSTQITTEELSNDDVQVISEDHEKTQPQDKQSKDTQTLKPKIRLVSNKKQYCCWAQLKILALIEEKRARRHECPPIECQCCCRVELQEFIKYKRVSRSLDQSIESVVQQTYYNTNPKSDLAAYRQNNIKTTSQNKPFRICFEDSSSSDGADNAIDSKDHPSTPAADSVDPASNHVPPIGAEVSVSSTIPKISIKISTNPDNTVQSLVQGLMQSTIPPARVVNKQIPESPLQKVRYLSGRRIPMPMSLVPLLPTNSPYNTETGSGSCKCIVPISVDSPQRKIIIDGSSTCPLHKTPKIGINEKQIFLTSRQIAQKPSQSPIFLGKNKILLTNIKFPPELKGEVNITPQAPQVKIIPTLPLPNGVQLVLQPNGELTYTIDPNVNVDRSSLEGLPQILDAVKQQLNCMELETANQSTKDVGITQNSEVVTLSDDETCEVNNSTEKSPTEIINTSNINVSNDISNTSDDTTKAKEISDNIIQSYPDVNAEEAQKVAELSQDHSNAIEQPVPNEISADIPTEVNKDLCIPTEVNKDVCIPIEVNKDVCDDQSIATQTNPQNNQTITVASDAQSNIEIKDSAVSKVVDSPTNEEAEENKDGKSKNILSDLMEMSGISAEDVTPAPAVTTPPDAVRTPPESDQHLTPLSVRDAPEVPQTELPANIATSLSEFSPIMSFAELKYACMQNGLFYKLDFETGSIVPINVCIKKHGDNKTVSAKVPASVTIDLTDEDVTENKSKQPLSPTRSLLIASQKSKPLHQYGKAKPVKLFKSVHPNILRDTSISNVHVVKNQDSFKNLPKLVPLRLKRKQDLNVLNKVEARIDMVDSDCPMEEEYLESSGSDDESRKRKAQSDDSSDEEPLSNVAKRMRDVNKDVETPEESKLATELAAEPATESATESAAEPETTRTDGKPLENFSLIYDGQSEEEEGQDDEEDAGDDCILGV